MEIAEIRSGLERFISDEMGSSARLEGLVESDGHAGLTFLFDVRDGRGSIAPYVIKLPPRGVRLKGNTDVYRQAPLLRALHGAGVPVPDVPWAYEHNDWFDLPFIIMERLPGDVFFSWDPPESFDRTKAGSQPLWEQCARTLPRLHQFAWRTHLPDWEKPESLETQIRRWERIYAQALDATWITAAEACERALLDSMPNGEPIGLFHGDYQPGNVLYQGGRLTGIIDWELAGIGAHLLDLGWLMMSADEDNWPATWRPIHPLAPAAIRQIYESEMGQRFDDIPWYQALAGYRLGCIACLNVKLHRKGQRHDPVWEKIALSVLPMFNHARDLANSLRAQQI
jgi:aminoglycoside phosphotransferase (APT) family kinase protein